jgi:hypothetical protein
VTTGNICEAHMYRLTMMDLRLSPVVITVILALCKTI